MAMVMKSEGLDELGALLNTLGEKAQGIASKGLYEGAGKMTDEIKKGAAGISSQKFHYAVFIQREVSDEEKAIVQDGCGISRFRKDGNGANTSVGYGNAGYAMLNGKRKPIPLIANAINSGTSFLKKQPFFRKAVTTGTPKAETAIIEKIEDEIDAINK